jgi:hypothetical protein
MPFQQMPLRHDRGVFSGGMRPVAKLFLVVIHLLMTVGFVVAGRASIRAQRD